jgi:hypothetical protein
MGSLTIVPIQSDGTFAAAVPEGVYRMSAVNAPPQYTVKSAVIGSTNLLKASFRVEKGKTPHEIRVSLEPR